MTARAFLNRVEVLYLEGVGAEGRARLRWQLRDPVGFAAAQAQEKDEQMRRAMTEAGGEIG